MSNRRERKDLSEWVIHFVHDRKSEDNPQDLQDIAEMEGFKGDIRLPDYYDVNGKGHNILTSFDENEYAIAEDAPAFDVLMKILHDGYIHSGWSLRDFIPTIYGPKSAVCFTEMPLYALVEYAKNRGEKTGYVNCYGIAFSYKELFGAGARQVIYGLSTEYKEAEDEADAYFGHGQRCLSESCGIGLEEQYRYVSTNLGKGKRIDWTHEREWRWALPNDKLGVPGLPFFLSKEYANFFSEIVIIVDTVEEQEETLEYLKNLYDSGGTGTGYYYNVKMIAATRVLSLESLKALPPEKLNTLRLDDLDLKQIPIMPTIEVKKETEEKALESIRIASKVAVDTVANYLEHHPNFDEQKGYWGFATVCTTEQTELTQALQNIGVCHTYSDGIYRLSLDEYRTCNLDLLEMGATAAAKYLEKELGQHFYVITRLD